MSAEGFIKVVWRPLRTILLQPSVVWILRFGGEFTKLSLLNKFFFVVTYENIV